MFAQDYCLQIRVHDMTRRSGFMMWPGLTACSISLATIPPMVNKSLIDYNMKLMMSPPTMTLSGPECSVSWAWLLLIFYLAKSLWLVKFHILDKSCYSKGYSCNLFFFSCVELNRICTVTSYIPSCLLVYPFGLATSVAKLTTVVRFPLSDNQVRMGRKETILVQMS